MIPAYMNYATGEFDYGSWQDAFFMPKPCMLKYDGTVDYYLDPNDYMKKADGTPSDASNTSYGGNVMIEFPKIWTKHTEDSTYEYTYIANYKIDSDTYCFANMDSLGNEIDHFYVAAYDCSVVSNRLRSISGISPLVSSTADQEVTYSRANELTSVQQWYVGQWCDRSLINDLLILISRSTDTQTSFGNGRVNESSPVQSGLLNSKGLFYGYSNTSSAVKVFGIENYWGNVWKRTVGLLLTNYKLYVKMTWSQADGSLVQGYSYTSVSGYIDAGITLPNSGGGHTISSTKNHEKFGMLVTNAASGYDSLYECDYAWWATSGVSCARLGGRFAGIYTNGAFAFAVNTAASGAQNDQGTSLSCKPLAQT